MSFQTLYRQPALFPGARATYWALASVRLISTLLLVISSIQAQEHTPQNEKNPFAGSVEAAVAGEKLYKAACQTCHGGNGTGDRGPALATGKFPHGSADGQIFISIRSGIQGSQMPPFSKLSTEQVWQLVSYIRSLNGANVKVNEVVAGDPAAGKSLFFGKANCSGCHAINGRGSIMAPDLSTAGANGAQTLRNKILNPNASPSGELDKNLGATVAKTKSGQTIRGIRKGEDSFSLHLMDNTGKLHRLDKQDLADLRYEGKSMMPGFATRLSDSEVQNLVAYLKTNTERDLSQTVQVPLAGGLTYDRIRNAAAEPHNWLTYWGDYQGTHATTLSQINKSNIKQLQAKWSVQMPGDAMLQSTPLVIDGIMYTTAMPGEVFAIDAKTGMVIWKYVRKQKILNPFESNRVSRGVAVLGNRVFFGTLDAALVALDARTGLPVWETQVANTLEGYSVTVSPLALKDKIIAGVAGGEHGIRGFVAAYDPTTGKELWRFNTVPGTGELGNDTWIGDSWKRGGAPTWLTGSYDPELDTLYWATGNPGPDMDGEIRKGDNLFSCSVVALDPQTGKRKWHYQFTPNDSHDWDANQDMVLVDRVFQGQMRKLLIQSNRNGMFYVLDRTNGKLLLGKPYVRQTWNGGFEADGKPKVIPNTDSTPEGRVVFPGLVGGTNWQAPSYDPKSGYEFIVYKDAGQKYIREKVEYEPGKAYWGGRAVPAYDNDSAGIMAIDTATGKAVWDYKIAKGSLAAGVLATSTGLLFAGTNEGHVIAFESATGKPLWKMQTGGAISSSPISYAINGKQYIAVPSGGAMISFSLPD